MLKFKPTKINFIPFFQIRSLSSIPKFQKAQVYDRFNGPLELRQIPVPIPGPNDILVNIKYSGVCHTDLHVWHGEFPGVVNFPLVGGHEGVGVVVAKGSHVTNFEIGEQAGIKWINGTCLCCDMCKKGFEPNCSNAQNSGLHRNGTFQEYALVTATEAPKIPAGVDLAKVAPILCAGVTVYRGLKESIVRPGEIVAINGAGGGLGSLAIQYAKAMGMRVIAVCKGLNQEEHVKRLGADHFVDVDTSEDVVKEIIALSEGGTHGVINTAPAQEPIIQATKYVRTRGTVVILSLPKNTPIGADIFDTVTRAITIRGSYVGNRIDTDEALAFFARGQIQSLIQIRGLTELPKIFDEMNIGTLVGRVVVDIEK
uniref:Enoyl reductase (ER) domain-containing protein n=1 Tax=Panagrolaimus sp. ES5 TaxID=591445 RepID=A0AC34FLU6_9BILA